MGGWVGGGGGRNSGLRSRWDSGPARAPGGAAALGGRRGGAPVEWAKLLGRPSGGGLSSTLGHPPKCPSRANEMVARAADCGDVGPSRPRLEGSERDGLGLGGVAALRPLP